MNKKIYPIYVALLFTELATSGYLLYRQSILISNADTPSIDMCKVLFLGSCDSTLQSDFLLLGLPWSAWGVLYFSSLGLLLLLAHFLKESFESAAFKAAYILLVLGSGLSIYLLVNILSGQAAFCALCLILHGLHLLTAYVLWRMYPLHPSKILESAGTALSYLFLGKSTNPASDKTKVITFLMLGFILLTGYQRLNFEIKVLKFFAVQVAIAANAEENFFAGKAVEIPIGTSDASIGPVNAPIELVVFSDFECPYCAEFALEYKKWQEAYPNQIRLIFKHYPLSNQCNPIMDQDMHPEACSAAKAAQAALTQNKFWEFHDALFEKGASKEVINTLATQLKLNTIQFEKDIQSTLIASKLKADIDLANQLGISGTPSVFLNKRKVENLSPEVLQDLIEKILQSKN